MATVAAIERLARHLTILEFDVPSYCTRRPLHTDARGTADRLSTVRALRRVFRGENLHERQPSETSFSHRFKFQFE